MKELNEIHQFIDDDCFDAANETENMKLSNMEVHTDYLNSKNGKPDNKVDSGIIYDSDEKLVGSSKYSSSNNCNANKNLQKTKELTDSGIDSIAKLSSTRALHSNLPDKLSGKSSSVVTMAAVPASRIPLRQQNTSRIRSKRYSLPDIDKLKQYNENKQSINSSSNVNRKAKATSTNKLQSNRKCDMKPQQEVKAKNPMVQENFLEPTSQNPNLNTFNIDPKLINKNDGLSQSLYYIDENGSPKIREQYIQKQRQMIEKREAKKREKELNQKTIESDSCSCFSFSRWSKKFKELCKFSSLLLFRVLLSFRKPLNCYPSIDFSFVRQYFGCFVVISHNWGTPERGERDWGEKEIKFHTHRLPTRTHCHVIIQNE